MAYLTFAGSEEKNSCFKFIGANSTQNNSAGLISSTTSLISNNVSLISAVENGLDTCSFYDGPSDATIFAFGESSETCGTIAYSDGGETCGSIAYSGGGETCGSIASSSSGASFSGGCSYSC